jgi:hypothetical protein
MGLANGILELDVHATRGAQNRLDPVVAETMEFGVEEVNEALSNCLFVLDGDPMIAVHGPVRVASHHPRFFLRVPHDQRFWSHHRR